MEKSAMLSARFILFTALFLSLSAARLHAAETAGADRIPAEQGDIQIRPINHATFELDWNGKHILVDPVGGAQRFGGVAPDLILVTDIHGDHLNAETLKGLLKAKTALVVPQAVADQLPADLKTKATVMHNGEQRTVQGMTIEAMPMYNLTPERQKYHNKGRGNGYVLMLGGKRIYICGDTEDIPEMRALKNIDVAFVCMNLPYTMTVEQAADAVKAFKPKIVYPYHYRGSDTEKFRHLLEGSGVEVRLRDWYAK
jgi:L-ascorbate metabolism protein UlaG (beta-lactamase superfamily)